MFIILLIISLSVFCSIAAFNFYTAPELKTLIANTNEDKLVSVLVPARNEEMNIVSCINGILSQSYKKIEIIIIDDCSTDNTYNIASSIKENNLKVIKGEILPEGWLGKNWACHQLAQNAAGEYLLFVDADVGIKKESISSAIHELNRTNAELISVFPTQLMKSFGEFIIVPLMNWLLLTFLPLKFVFTSSSNSFVAANGQFMLWKRDTYFNLGGHQKVKDKVVEDMELARLVKQNNFKVETLLGGDLVFCRMYSSFKQAYNGFAKNFYAGFSINPIFFILIIFFLFIVFIVPFIIITQSVFAIIPVLLVLAARFFVSLSSKQNWWINIILHPLQMILMIWIGIVSLIKFKSNSLVWKERKI